MTDDDLTTAHEVEHRLSKLVNDYRRREPWTRICEHALRETFKENYPTWAANYELRIKWTGPTGVNQRAQRGHVELVFRSAVDRLGELAAKAAYEKGLAGEVSADQLCEEWNA